MKNDPIISTDYILNMLFGISYFSNLNCKY